MVWKFDELQICKVHPVQYLSTKYVLNVEESGLTQFAAQCAVNFSLASIWISFWSQQGSGHTDLLCLRLDFSSVPGLLFAFL